MHFGEEANENLWIGLLNGLIPTEHQIAELNFKSTKQKLPIPLDRNAKEINLSRIRLQEFLKGCAGN